MTSRHMKPGLSSPDEQNHEQDRIYVVSEWRDADRMREADLSGEVAGQRVVAHHGDHGQPIPYRKEMMGALTHLPGTPGFLFSGDDGDSLWFWPESGPVAFRFEEDAGNRLRAQFGEDIDRLVSQGALVYCIETHAERQGDPVLHFPELESRAA